MGLNAEHAESQRRGVCLGLIKMNSYLGPGCVHRKYQRYESFLCVSAPLRPLRYFPVNLKSESQR